MKLDSIDRGKEFDFGRTSKDYAEYRDIYPKNMYKKLISFGIGKKGQKILDLGSGTAVLPINLYETGAKFTATDISENQIYYAKLNAEKKGCKKINFKVCPAENTGFPDSNFDVVTAVQCFHYFNPEDAATEIRKILKPNGLFCKIFMDWLPYEDKVIKQMEELVLKYNPDWTGNGFKDFKYSYPKWADNKFKINTVHSYNTIIDFTKEEWIKRIKTCRGVGASLSDFEIQKFEKEYRKLLDEYGTNYLHLKHQIHIEIYSSTKEY